jgi:hypothetical protein
VIVFIGSWLLVTCTHVSNLDNPLNVSSRIQRINSALVSSDLLYRITYIQFALYPRARYPLSVNQTPPAVSILLETINVQTSPVDSSWPSSGAHCASFAFAPGGHPLCVGQAIETPHELMQVSQQVSLPRLANESEGHLNASHICSQACLFRL